MEISKYKKILLFLTVFLSGAVVLIVEILGTRILAPFFGSSIFIWSSLITVTMGALSLAYYFGGKIIDRRPNSKVLFTFVLIAGFFLMIIMKINQLVLPFCDGFGLRYGPLVASMILFGLPLLLLGMASPMVIRLIFNDKQSAGSSVGRVFAVGTVGSIAGALGAGFFLLPYFTLSTIFIACGIILIIIAMIGLFSVKVSLIGILLIISSIFMPLFKISAASNNYKIIHQEQGFYGNIKIVDQGSARCIYVDGASESCINLYASETSFPYINEMGRIAQERPQDKNVLMLGLGGGSLASYFNENQDVDIVEINPRIIDLAKQYFKFAPNGNDHVYTDDARHFLRANDRKYDLVAMDVFASISVPTHLVTKDYFGLVKSRLNDNGLVVINLIGEVNPTDQYTLSFLQTLKSVFPSVVATVEKDVLTNLVIRAGNNESVTKSASSNFQTVDIDTTGAKIFTDAKNSADVSAIPLQETVLRNYWKSSDRINLLFTN